MRQSHHLNSAIGRWRHRSPYGDTGLVEGLVDALRQAGLLDRGESPSRSAQRSVSALLLPDRVGGEFALEHRVSIERRGTVTDLVDHVLVHQAQDPAELSPRHLI